MSVLEIPRIYLRGQIAWDPVTTNNYPVTQAPAAYDEDKAEASLNQDAVTAASVAAFRQAAIEEVVSAGNWNPHGTYRSPFFDTVITGVDTGSGLDVDDPFVSAPVAFTGMLVDCEPYGAYSSQLFFDDMSFGIAGGCRIYGRRVTRFHDRYLNFSANPNNNAIAGVASVMWQTCFPKDDHLQIDSHGSAALQALTDAMNDPNVLGVMVRMCTYRTFYYADGTLSNGSSGMVNKSKALRAKLNAGGFQPNPARSLLVGTVGLWCVDDPPHEPGDRALLPTDVPINVGTGVSPAHCGTAFARVGQNRITLDLSNAIPAVNRATDKVPLGDLRLTAADPPPAVAVVEVATIPAAAYARAAYEATSGIIDIPIAASLAASLAGLDLSISAGETAYFSEAPLRAIPADPNLYVDQGISAVTSVRVYERGIPTGSGVNVAMSELGATQGAAVVRQTDASGTATFPLVTGTAGVTGLVFQPGPAPTLPVTGRAFNPSLFTYMYLRVLPEDSAIGALPPTWPNVHNWVLCNWEAMAPCMDNWLHLGDPKQVLGIADLIKQLTDPENFEGFRFMPVTRDLTRGQRQLLYAFLGSGGIVSAQQDVVALTVPPEVGRDFDALSRSERRPI